MSLSLHILQSAELNARLEAEGYVILPLLSMEQVQALRDAYFAHHAQSPERFYASAHARDTDFRLKMSRLILEVVQPACAPWLQDAELLGGSFIAKPQGQKGILPPHADWNIVDERIARSYNLWIPLVDTRPENGAVHILPHSHLGFDSFRGPGIANPFAPLGESIWKAMQPLSMKAGQALLYDHRLVHASPQNQTPELRLATVSGLIPKGAEMRYYCMDQGKIAAYRANVAFFLEGDPEQGPGGLPFLGHESEATLRIHAKQFQDFLDERGIGAAAKAPAQPASFWARLQSWLKP